MSDNWRCSDCKKFVPLGVVRCLTCSIDHGAMKKYLSDREAESSPPQPVAVQEKCAECGYPDHTHPGRHCDKFISSPSPAATTQPEDVGEVQVMTVTWQDAVKSLEAIFYDLQAPNRFHDQWDWMEAYFNLNVLKATIADLTQPGLKPTTTQPPACPHGLIYGAFCEVCGKAPASAATTQEKGIRECVKCANTWIGGETDPCPDCEVPAPVHASTTRGDETFEGVRRSIAAAHNLINDWHEPDYGKRAVEAQDILNEAILSIIRLEPKPAPQVPEKLECKQCGDLMTQFTTNEDGWGICIDCAKKPAPQDEGFEEAWHSYRPALSNAQIGWKAVAQWMWSAAQVPLLKRIEELKEERDLAIERRDWTQQWYAQRHQRMDDWMRKEAPEGAKNQYFSIAANGTKDPFEPPTYAQQFNVMKWRAEKAEARIAELESAQPKAEKVERLVSDQELDLRCCWKEATPRIKMRIARELQAYRQRDERGGE